MVPRGVGMEKTLFDAKEAAAYLRITTQTLANWRHVKRGPSYRKMGGKILYHEGDLRQFIDSSLVDIPGGKKKCLMKVHVRRFLEPKN